MNQHKFAFRVGVLVLLIAVMAGVFSVRLHNVQITQAAEQDPTPSGSVTYHTRVTAARGEILDRNGNVLAASEECMNIALNTKQITDADAVVDALVDHLGVERSYAREKVGEDTTWTYVKMKVDTEVAEALLDEGLAGVEYEHAMKRVYPYGTLASQVLGVVGSDNVGISGLELQYEDELQGENGWMVRERAADGTYIAGGAYEKQDPRDGSDLVLTLDINIQRAAEDALAEAVASSGANYGSVIVTDPATGDILAACSYPTYDPADLSTARTEDMNLRVVTDAYETFGEGFKQFPDKNTIQAE